jgi:hypothetical protein
MMFSTWATTSRVRLSEAPSGSRMAAKNTPWSSDGRKPCGVIRNRPNEASKTAATSTIPSTTSTGTTAAKESSGSTSRSAAPVRPPATAAVASRSSRAR